MRTHWPLALVGHNKRVLELGCYAGHMTRALQQYGCAVTGIEIDAEAALEAAEYAHEVITADLERDPWTDKVPHEYFRTSCSWAMCSSISSIRSRCCARAEICCDRTAPLSSVPNVANVDVKLALLQGRFEYTHAGLLDKGHLRFFTKASLDDLVRDADCFPSASTGW